MYFIILAAGNGKRMQSDLPKVLHTVDGIPMINRIISEIKKVKYGNNNKIVIVVNPNNIDKIKEVVNDDTILWAIQNNPMGTGDAIRACLEYLNDEEDSIIINGDCPMMSKMVLEMVIENATNVIPDIQVTAIRSSNPTGCGRIIGICDRIVEEKDCTPEELKINMVNCGLYYVKNQILKEYIPQLKNNNNQSEYYLTDTIEMVKKDKKNVGLCLLSSLFEMEVSNINTKAQLDELEYKIRNNQL